MSSPKPIDQWRSSIFQISKWEHENEEYGKYCNYSIQKSFKKKETDIWKNQSISNCNISDLNRLNILITEIIREHFIKKGD
jgi:hypothetical protein